MGRLGFTFVICQSLLTATLAMSASANDEGRLQRFAQPALRESQFDTPLPQKPAGPETAQSETTKSDPAQPAPQAGKRKGAEKAAEKPGSGGAWPKTLPEAKAEAAAAKEPVPTAWSAADIELAKARCTSLLKQIDAVTIPAEPIRQGECGAPAPVQLVSVGRNPEVVLSPPAVVTCDMAVALHTWLKSDLQPLAKKLLGQPIIKIENMSDYSCRNAYGRAKTRLSEHGRANALDIRGFITAKGDQAVVLDHWGMTARDVRAQVAARKATEKPTETGSTTKAPTPAGGETLAAPAGKPTTGEPAKAAAGALTDALPKVRIGGARKESGAETGTASGLGLAPSKLGGPKPKTAAQGEPVPASQATGKAELKKTGEKTGEKPAAGTEATQDTRKTQFLREAHVRACKIFGTVLGPEANNAHRNHFHVDMAERRSGAFCE